MAKTALLRCGLLLCDLIVLSPFALAPANACAADGLPSGSVASPTNRVIMPFQYRRGHVMVPVEVAGTNTQQFIIDSGYSITMLPPGLGDALQLRRTGHVTIVGIAGEEEAGVFEGPPLNIGGMTWTSRRVGSFPLADPVRGSRRREGVLGSGLFRRFVVIFDQQSRTVEFQEPSTFDYNGPGEILPIRFRRGSNTPVVSATLHASGTNVVIGDFEVDTGCDSALCLASDFSERNHLIPENSHSSSRSGVGGGTRTRAGKLQALRLGALRVDHPSAEFFLQGSPAGNGMAGHIGLESFRNFRTILDYSRLRLILEPLRRQ